jgi:hypothetical protein
MFAQRISTETSPYLESIQSKFFEIIEGHFNVGNFLVKIDVGADTTTLAIGCLGQAAAARGFDNVHGAISQMGECDRLMLPLSDDKETSAVSLSSMVSSSSPINISARGTCFPSKI